MAIYRTIQMAFWTDSKIIDTFTPEDRYFYLYLLTNTHTNLSGCYEISKKQMAIETGYSVDTINQLLIRMCKSHEVAFYSSTTKEILLINWYKYNWTSSEKFRIPLQEEIDNVKDPIFHEFLVGLFEGKDTVSIRYGYGMDTTDTDTVTVSDTVNENNTLNITVSNKNRCTKFIPPTIEEIESYIKEKGYKVNAQKFYSFYDSKGWYVGKNKMVSWKSAVAGWNANEIENGSGKIRSKYL